MRCSNDWKFWILKRHFHEYWSHLGAMCKIGGKFVKSLMVCSGGETGLWES